jgi:hypothetical protein
LSNVSHHHEGTGTKITLTGGLWRLHRSQVEICDIADIDDGESKTRDSGQFSVKHPGYNLD